LRSYTKIAYKERLSDFLSSLSYSKFVVKESPFQARCYPSFSALRKVNLISVHVFYFLMCWYVGFLTVWSIWMLKFPDRFWLISTANQWQSLPILNVDCLVVRLKFWWVRSVSSSSLPMSVLDSLFFLSWILLILTLTYSYWFHLQEVVLLSLVSKFRIDHNRLPL